MSSTLTLVQDEVSGVDRSGPSPAESSWLQDSAVVHDGLPEVPRSQQGGPSPNSQPFIQSLKDSAAHSRDFTSATMWSTPHATSTTSPGTVTWQNITQRSTELEGKQLSSPQPAPIIGCMVSTLLFAWLILNQCFLTRHGKNWSSLLPIPKQPLTFFPQTKSSPRSAKQPSNSHD